MYGIFCPANDLPALWAYYGLKRRGLAPLEIFTPEALVYNRRLEHRLQNGETFTRLALADGRVLESNAVRGVLNRISALPLEHFRAANPIDQAYAVQEQHAVFLSWLYGLPGALINRPGPRGLCGDNRSRAEWAWLASQAGLPSLPFRQSDEIPGETQSNNPETAFQVIVLDGEIYGNQTALKALVIYGKSVARLADSSGLRLMGIEFRYSKEGEPVFASASPVPDLRLGGEALLDALARALA